MVSLTSLSTWIKQIPRGAPRHVDHAQTHRRRAGNVPRAAEDLVWHCRPFPPVLLSELIRITSGAPTSSPPSPNLSPAVSSTILATTAQRAAELECWAGGFCSGERGSSDEAGARVSTKVFVRDLDLLAPNVQDARRSEIVAEGLPLHGGAQLVVDTTLVSAHHCDGTARPGAAHIDGAALVVARRRKERACPELVGPRSRVKVVVLAGEVGGRWSEETVTFWRLLGAPEGKGPCPPPPPPSPTFEPPSPLDARPPLRSPDPPPPSKPPSLQKTTATPSQERRLVSNVSVTHDHFLEFNTLAFGSCGGVGCWRWASSGVSIL